MQRLLSEIGRSQRLAVVNLLKRSMGMTVREMAAKLQMSYMGVKTICLGLEKDGYVKTTRRNHGVGRPELLHLLTPKAHDLFPQQDNDLAISLLQQARKLFGTAAAEKILFLHFQQKTADYSAQINGGSVPEKAASLVRLREREGYMAEFQKTPQLCLIERHNPMRALQESFPEITTMEREMFQRLLGVPIRSESRNAGGNRETLFFVD
jgi:predicted ArsR family transcriptional regulator